MLTQEHLKSILEYNPETGMFVWKWREHLGNHINARRAGKEAGNESCLNGRWYRQIAISGSRYLAHRLAWLYIYGYMPESLDHKDGNGLNNIITNLREATQSQNMANRYTGAKVERHGRKYRARIMINRIHIELGSYDTEQEAVEAYWAGRLKYFGEFARV